MNILYRENDWVYVIAAESRQEGFIPHSYCTPYNSQLGELAMNNVKKKLPRTLNDGENDPPPETRAGIAFLLSTTTFFKYFKLKTILRTAFKNNTSTFIGNGFRNCQGQFNWKVIKYFV